MLLLKLHKTADFGSCNERGRDFEDAGKAAGACYEGNCKEINPQEKCCFGNVTDVELFSDIILQK